MRENTSDSLIRLEASKALKKISDDTTYDPRTR